MYVYSMLCNAGSGVLARRTAMPITSTETRYGSVAILIHWTSALAVILAFCAGFFVAHVAAPGQQATVLIAHITLGVIVFALTLLRILWWLVADRHPAPPADQPNWQRRTANVVHVLLYVLLLLMATSGIATIIASGALPDLIAGTALPRFEEFIPRIAHGVMSRLLLALFVVHVGAALYHQLVRRDRLLARMGLG
jgi:cytochrome b561